MKFQQYDICEYIGTDLYMRGTWKFLREHSSGDTAYCQPISATPPISRQILDGASTSSLISLSALQLHLQPGDVCIYVGDYERDFGGTWEFVGRNGNDIICRPISADPPDGRCSEPNGTFRLWSSSLRKVALRQPVIKQLPSHAVAEETDKIIAELQGSYPKADVSLCYGQFNL